MAMEIDEAMNNLGGILKEATKDEDSVCYVTENDAETLQAAIVIMRKYQKIEQILKDDNYYEEYGNNAEKFIVSAICEVLKDGKID